MGETARVVWDRQAATFDDEPDHGLRDPSVRRAWLARLLPLLPATPSRVLDVGCGTGSVSVLMAGAGHLVCGVDVSGRMLDRARAKAAADGVPVALVQGDAAGCRSHQHRSHVICCGRSAIGMPCWPAGSSG